MGIHCASHTVYINYLRILVPPLQALVSLLLPSNATVSLHSLFLCSHSAATVLLSFEGAKYANLVLLSSIVLLMLLSSNTAATTAAVTVRKVKGS
jgi:hypothetical protein